MGGKILRAPGALMEGTVPKGRFPLYRDFVPHRTSSRTWDEVRANQSGRLVCMSGLWPQGRCAAAAALFILGLVHFRLGENERGSFALCGARPGSTWTGQPARLDRAGPRARTRLSPAGGIPFAARWCLRCFLGDLVTFRFLLPFLSLFLTPFSSLMTR